ncbi:MAG: hypothetical protein SFY96_06290 [Planctomycetota bacterium]|nr:hypothetical protein [Planctomycetota bacterium]
MPGWWAAANKSDTQGISGLPGVGTTSAGLTLPSAGEWAIPLGAYPQSVSPWGLLDTSGGAEEWTEDYAPNDAPRGRNAMGAGVDGTISSESITFVFSIPPDSLYPTGLRIASSVPAPPALVIVPAFISLLVSRRARQSPDHQNVPESFEALQD